jgi:hypothetical protein
MMGINSLYPFPNEFQREIIVLMNGKVITFESQNIYTNNIAFKRAMNGLHDLKIAVCRHVKNSNNEYKLTLFGEHIADVLIKFSRLKHE